MQLQSLCRDHSAKVNAVFRCFCDFFGENVRIIRLFPTLIMRIELCVAGSGMGIDLARLNQVGLD